MPGSSLVKCSSISFSHVPIVHKAVVGMTNGLGDGRLRGIGTDRKRVRKE